jgi:eukaryotic-like serine/threonine-protein kinase
MTRRLYTSPGDGMERPRPGDVLGGKYRIERELGSGGMGVVYEVTHLVMTQTRFAIKWLLPLQGDPDASRRFRREARIAGAIRHPNVVEVYDVNVDDAGAYMVMELLEGESLAAYMARSGPLPPGEACRIMLQCIDGLSAAHAASVIHRDIKPANIFLCRDPHSGAVRPKLLDFGISRVLSAGTGTATTHTRGAIAGTPAYMAPEQLTGQDCDVRTDVYSLGVTLYEALAGARPFEAKSDVDLAVKIATGNFVPLRKRVQGLPSGLVRAVTTAMKKAPARRFASAQELALALVPFARSDAAPARPQPSAAGTRLPWLAAAVTMIGVLALALWQLLDRSDPEYSPRSSDRVATMGAGGRFAAAPEHSQSAATRESSARLVSPAVEPGAAGAPQRAAAQPAAAAPAQPAAAAPAQPAAAAPVRAPTTTPREWSPRPAKRAGRERPRSPMASSIAADAGSPATPATSEPRSPNPQQPRAAEPVRPAEPPGPRPKPSIEFNSL